MYSYIRGVLTEILEDAIVVEASGVGYYIQIGSALIDQLGKIGDEVTCYVHLHLSQDKLQLIGFPNREYKQLFEKLITVSNVGPKNGIALLNEFDPRELSLLIVREDSKTISKRMRGKGVGKKTAERIILELKDKFKDTISEDETSTSEQIQPDNSRTYTDEQSQQRDEILQGLLFLGYNLPEAKNLLDQSFDSELAIEDNLRNALKLVNK